MILKLLKEICYLVICYPAVCTNTFVVQKHYDYNTSSEIRLSSIEDMKLLEILEEFQNSNEIINSGSSCDVIPDKRLKRLFLLRHCLQFKWQGFIQR